jgi:hypothetical protein
VSDAIAFALHLFGYPVSIVVIARWIPVVRERRTKWFIAHQLAVAAIVAGWAIKGDGMAVVINGTWFVIAAIWYSIPALRARRGVRT